MDINKTKLHYNPWVSPMRCLIPGEWARILAVTLGGEGAEGESAVPCYSGPCLSGFQKHPLSGKRLSLVRVPSFCGDSPSNGMGPKQALALGLKASSPTPRHSPHTSNLWTSPACVGVWQPPCSGDVRAALTCLSPRPASAPAPHPPAQL